MPTLPVYMAAPWYNYWPYDGHFQTVAPMASGAFYPPPAYTGNPFLTGRYPGYVPATPVPGLTGAVAFTANPTSIVTAILKKRTHGNIGPLEALIVPALTAHLQSLDGSVDSETSGLHGHLKLTIR